MSRHSSLFEEEEEMQRAGGSSSRSPSSTIIMGSIRKEEVEEHHKPPSKVSHFSYSILTQIQSSEQGRSSNKMSSKQQTLEESDSLMSNSGRDHEDDNSSDNESSSAHSSSAGTSQTGSISRGNSMAAIASKESRFVFGSKMLVMFCLFIAAGVCASMTYIFTARGEEQAFEAMIEDYSNELLEVSTLQGQAKVATLNGFATTITSYALDSKADWPYVTLPHWERRVEQIMRISGAVNLGFAPLVEEVEREQWKNYTLSHQDWIPNYEEWSMGGQFDIISGDITVGDFSAGTIVEDPGSFKYYPSWQISPIEQQDLVYVNMNLYSTWKSLAQTEAWMLQSQSTTISDIQLEVAGDGTPDPNDVYSWPSSFVLEPIFDEFDDTGRIHGMLAGIIPWHVYFMNVLPEGTDPIFVVLESRLKGASENDDDSDKTIHMGGSENHKHSDNTFHHCDHVVTYEVTGPSVKFLGYGDLHDTDFDVETFLGTLDLVDNIPDDACEFLLHAYPSREFYEATQSRRPLYYTLAIVGVFVMTCLVFLLYDWFVTRRQQKVLSTATRSNAILSSLFPAQVRDRLMEEQGEREAAAAGTKKKVALKASAPVPIRESNDNSGMENTGPMTSDALLGSKPIADLFPSATVMFADIAGFTAWSSTRDPAQVFTLLEQIYSSFDAIAKKRKVFKVETIGDCYVACCGLPEPREDHAEVMLKFAMECRTKMNMVVRKLEVLLGPDTCDLSMRIGLHSGAVTAGVLRGEKSRFQLFGDTVNTASRIESSGQANRIHLSQATAELLIAAGKEDHIVKREELVQAKGKGELQTYWVKDKKPSSGNREGSTGVRDDSDTQSEDGSRDTQIDMRQLRLIQWNVDVLARQLKRILAMRENRSRTIGGHLRYKIDPDSHVIDEIKEVIPLSNEAKSFQIDPDEVELTSAVMEQLTDYVSNIAMLYHDENPFHCFEHASHVALSATKLLSRVVRSDKIDYNDLEYKEISDEALHDHTFGITSDPIIQFALAYAALIHDVDHTGVPNATLVSEGTDLAQHYNNKSVAEQNSVDLAWDLLQEPSYSDLRACIYESSEELERFRQLVVNAVMATDICDKELGALRKERWNKAFYESNQNDDHTTIVNRKATIVIEHLIQASDVAHTMQHWHVYIKWNERLFDELYKAYLEGRSESDPSEGWYKGEMGFFDFYIIPLAKKLKDCGVFGVSSDEYLDYARANRREWELKGEEVVAKYLAKYEED